MDDLKALGVITCCADCKFLISKGCDSVQCTKTGNTFYVWDIGGWGNPDIRHPTCPFPKLENLVERKKGEWLEDYDGFKFIYRCSNCSEQPLTKYGTMHDYVLSEFCHKCGADMR